MRVLVVSSTFPQYRGDPRGQFVLRHWEQRVEGGEGLGGIPELCPPESGAVLVEPGDARALAAALTRALQSVLSPVAESV